MMRKLLNAIVAVSSLAAVILIADSATAQAAQPGNSAFQDWSTRHSIYPDTLPPGQQSKFARDPRWINQWRLNHSAGVPPRRKTGTAPNTNVQQRDWAVSLGGTAPGSGVAEGVFPAKFTYNVMAPPDCTKDFMVFPINSKPAVADGNTPGQANIVAFNWLYSGPNQSGYCDSQPGPSSRPNALWAYAIGSGRIASSPVPSLDGKKIAFIESPDSGSAVLHILRWAPEEGTVTAPVRPASAGPTTACPETGSCDFAIPLDTTSKSSPYVDYENDVAWVGDDDGRLYRIRGVFGASAPQFDSSVKLSQHPLTSPVYDPGGKVAVVSDGTVLYTVDPKNWQITPFYPNIGNMVDGPMIDFRPDKQTQTQGYTVVWVFGSGPTTAPMVGQIVYNWPTIALNRPIVTDPIGAPGGPPIRSGMLTGGVYLPTYGGGGFLFVCGNQGVGAQNKPRLYRYDIEGNGTLKSAPSPKYSDMGTDEGRCSPPSYSYVPPFDPNAPEWAFVGYIKSLLTPLPSGTAGSVQQWVVKGAFNPRDNPAYQVYQAAGTSGIVIDNLANTGTYPQAASIYFGTLGSSDACGGKVCAVKLTQATLQ